MNKPSKTEQANVLKKTLLIVVAIISGIAVSLLYRNIVTPFLSERLDPSVKALQSFTLDQRPSGGMLLFDYAHILQGAEEGINNYLDRIRSKNGIELTIITLPSLSGIKPMGTIQETAFRIFNGWNVGRDYNGRGALILMVQDAGQVKIEVAQNMEDVFTDLFSGFAADQQLKPHLEQGTAGFALVAIMEEFEQRAYLKQTGNYTPNIIAARDRKFLSMGAGVQRRVSDYNVQQQNKNFTLPPSDKKGVLNPDKAWKVVVSKFLGSRKHKELDIFSEATKLISGDQDSLRYNWASVYSNMPHKILQEGNYAIVSFGAKKGWDNSPLLLIRTQNPDGWKLDFVSQRKYVVMGSAPNWHIERGNHPYVYLANYAWTRIGKDIPIEPDDMYTAERDSLFAAQYRGFAQKFKQNPNDFETAMQLGRLGTIMALLPQDIHPYLRKAAALNPDSPLPHKYLAIQTVESNYQYKTALAEMRKFLSKGGDPVFGNNYLGFLLLKTKKRAAAIRAFNASLAYGYKHIDDIANTAERFRIQEQAIYSYDRLVRTYYKKDAPVMVAMYDKMKTIDPSHWRVAMDRWVEKFR